MAASTPTRVDPAGLTLPAPARAAFPPSRSAALERLAAVDATAYARTRNHLRGAVTRLSPYLTHGLLSVPEVVAAAGDLNSKLVQELGWREYFQLVHVHEGAAILRDRFGPQPRIAADAGPRRLPRALVEGRTGVHVLDEGRRALVEEGYVHNHARMWLAVVACHVAGADWRAGTFLDRPREALLGDPIPQVLRKTIDLDLPSEVPDLPPPALDPKRRLLLYHPWCLDPTWRAGDDADRWLLLEPAFLERHPWSRIRLAWVLAAASEVPGLRVAVADARTVLAPRLAAHARGEAAPVLHRAHPAVAHWPGPRDELPTAFAHRWQRASAPRSFSAYWREVGPGGR